jgi:hypothetical protein
MSVARGKRDIEASRKETEKLRGTVAVGVGQTYEQALDNAWEVAKELGARRRTRYRVVDHTGVGVNPFSDHRVVIIPGG